MPQTSEHQEPIQFVGFLEPIWKVCFARSRWRSPQMNTLVLHSREGRSFLDTNQGTAAVASLPPHLVF